ncbi:MAG TPA: hypothetical protein VKA53_10520 [Thermoanaerobaculia bacterium]|nr:hypothetical protein [Thermoanaerobaculia bacterium]
MSRKFFHKTVIPFAIAGVFTLVSAAQLQAMPRLHQAARGWDATPVAAQSQTQARSGFFEQVWSFLTSLFAGEGATINPNG